MEDNERRTYQRGYSSGYNAGSRGRWPAHKPPYPPLLIVAEMMQVLREVRNGLDVELAALCDEDYERRFGPLIDKADAIAEKVSKWLQTVE